jgi:hypothetical protein
MEKGAAGVWQMGRCMGIWGLAGSACAGAARSASVVSTCLSNSICLGGLSLSGRCLIQWYLPCMEAHLDNQSCINYCPHACVPACLL